MPNENTLLFTWYLISMQYQAIDHSYQFQEFFSCPINIACIVFIKELKLKIRFEGKQIDNIERNIIIRHNIKSKEKEFTCSQGRRTLLPSTKYIR